MFLMRNIYCRVRLCVCVNSYLHFVDNGTTKPEYLSINLRANDIKLTLDILANLESAYLELEKEIKEKYGKSVREFRGLNEKFY